jgi:hypothetical protein
MNLSRPWPQGSRSGGMAEVADRVCCGGAYGGLRPPPSVLKKTPTLNVQEGSREALPHKKGKTMWWPWRGRRGLRPHRQDSSHGGGDRAVRGFLYGTGYRSRRDSRSRPGSTGKYEHEDGRGDVETTLKEKCQCTTAEAGARWSF